MRALDVDKQGMRARFVEELCSADHKLADTALGAPFFDFETLFCNILKTSGVEMTDACNEILCDSDENFEISLDDEKNQILDGLIYKSRFYVTHRHIFMSFLAFVVKRDKGLARMVFRHRRRLSELVFDKTFYTSDLDIVLGWDREIGSDIFQDERGSFMLQLCNRVYISTHETDKMKRIVSAYGPDLLQWLPRGGNYRQSCVNSFLFSGNIFRKHWHGADIATEVEYALDYLITTCPQALNMSTTDDMGNRLDGFVHVLRTCRSLDEPLDALLVEKVFQHMSVHDMHNVCYTRSGATFIDLVSSSRNALVARFLCEKRGVAVAFPPLL